MIETAKIPEPAELVAAKGSKGIGYAVHPEIAERITQLEAALGDALEVIEAFAPKRWWASNPRKARIRALLPPLDPPRQTP